GRTDRQLARDRSVTRASVTVTYRRRWSSTATSEPASRTTERQKAGNAGALDPPSGALAGVVPASSDDNATNQPPVSLRTVAVFPDLRAPRPARHHRNGVDSRPRSAALTMSPPSPCTPPVPRRPLAIGNRDHRRPGGER